MYEHCQADIIITDRMCFALVAGFNPATEDTSLHVVTGPSWDHGACGWATYSSTLILGGPVQLRRTSLLHTFREVGLGPTLPSKRHPDADGDKPSRRGNGKRGRRIITEMETHARP